MGIVCCTACGRQVNHFRKDSLYRHPVLKVLICKVSTYMCETKLSVFKRLYFILVKYVVKIYEI